MITYGALVSGSGELLFAVLRESHAAAHGHITRAALFGLCTLLASPAATTIDSICTPLISYLFPLLSKPPSLDADETKLRAGITDCLAALARVSLRRLPASFSLQSPVQEVNGAARTEEQGGAAAVLPQLLSSLAEELRQPTLAAPLPARIASACALIFFFVFNGICSYSRGTVSSRVT